MDKLKKKIKKIIALVVALAVAVVIIFNAIIAPIVEFLEFRDGDFIVDWWNGFFAEEKTVPIAQNTLLEVELDEASYGMYDRISAENKGFIEAISDFLITDDLKLAMDILNQNMVDANAKKVLGLQQNNNFSENEDIKTILLDADNKEFRYKILNEVIIKILMNQLHNEGVDGLSLFYPEAFTKPVPTVYDYVRVTQATDSKGNPIYERYIFIQEWDNDGNKINKPHGKIASLKVKEINDNDYYKMADGIHYNTIKDFELGETVENQYGREVQRIEFENIYDIDEDGEPIVLKGQEPPFKMLQKVPVEDHAGNKIVFSDVKYNIDTSSEKKPIYDKDYTKITREMAKELMANDTENRYYGQHGVALANKDALELYIEEKLEGAENEDWYRDYQGEYKVLGVRNDDGTLEYTAKEEYFRYFYFNDVLHDKVSDDFVNGKVVQRDEFDRSWETKNLEYAWSYDVEKMVDKNTREIIPIRRNSVADWGLAPVFSYIRAMQVNYKQAVSIKEERNPQDAGRYINEKHNNNFPEASNGAYPEIFEDQDIKLRDNSFNVEELAYIDDFVQSTNGNLGKTEYFDKHGNVVGNNKFDNQEIFDKTRFHSPTVRTANMFDNTTVDQYTNPTKYYMYWGEKALEKNPEDTLFPLVSMIGDVITEEDFVDEETKFETLSYADVTPISLINMAVTAFQEIFITYEDEARVESELSANESKIQIGSYYVDKKYIGKKFEVLLEIEETTYDSEVVRDADGKAKRDSNGKIKKKWSKETDTVERLVKVENVNLEVFTEDLPDTQYGENDMGDIIADIAFKHGQYNNPKEIRVPTLSQDEIDEYNFERGEKKTSSYKKSEVIDIKIRFIFEDKTAGVEKPIYEQFSGYIMTVRPVVKETYDNFEKEDDRLAGLNPANKSITEINNINDEQEAIMMYFEDYIRNYLEDAYIPNQVLMDYTALDRSDDDYYNVVQVNEVRKLSPYYASFRRTLYDTFDSDIWKKAFRKLNIGGGREEEIMSQFLLGMLQELGKRDSEHRVGGLNLYIDGDANSNDFHDSKYAESFFIDEEGAMDDIQALNYFSYSMANAIVNRGGKLDEATLVYNASLPVAEELLKMRKDTFGRINDVEFVNMIENLGQRNDPNASVDLFNSAFEYIGKKEDQQRLAKTATNMFQEILNSADDIINDTVDTADALLDKLTNYTTKENKGIYHITGDKLSMDEVEFTMARILAQLNKVENFEEVELKGQLLTWLSAGRMAGNMGGTSATGLQDFANLLEIDGMVTPIALNDNGVAVITSSYGQRFHPVYKKWRWHNGIDLGYPNGTPLLSIADQGEVIFSDFVGGAGNMIIVKYNNVKGDEDDYILAVYMHMNSKSPLKVGTIVNAGDVVGFVGNTGTSTNKDKGGGFHLHFEIRANISEDNPNYDEWQQYIDKEHKNTVNPFWFVTANPTPDQIERFMETKH